MDGIAIYSDNLTIYYSALVIAAAAAVFWITGFSLYTPRHGHRGAMCAFVPLSVLLSVPLARFLHWYCHSEQYEGFISAVTDYSTGSFCYPGIIVGIFLAGLIIWKLFLHESPLALYDCLSPGAALGLGLLRLTALFDTSCRGKITIESLSGGEATRLPTYMLELILLFILATVLFKLFAEKTSVMRGQCPENGNLALCFLSWFSAIEIVTDSTRYDSSFLHFNGFVSLVQIAAILAIIGVFVYYNIMEHHAEQQDGRTAVHWKIRVAFIFCFIVTGAAEYLVQRFGGMYIPCYTFMSLACACLAILNRKMYKRLVVHK